MEQASSRKYIFLICGFLVLATVGGYWQVYDYEFINYDDDEYITENPHVSGGFSSESVVWAFTTSRGGNWHPLTWLSHMADCQLFGLRAGAHHLVNLFFHVTNALLLFLILQKITGAIWCSGFVAAAFALHPLRVESVAWVSERKDVLSVFFWLLTMWAYIRYVKCPGAGKYALILLFFALGLMAKPMLVTLPFVLLLVDYWPLERLSKRSLLEKIPLLVLVAASSLITVLIEVVIPQELIGLKVRVANTFISYAGYIGKTIWPSGLGLFYPHPVEAISMLVASASAIVLVIITVRIVRLGGVRKYLLTGWLWYIVTLVPVIGLVQIGKQAMADRYTYLPSIGLFIMVAWGVAEVSVKLRHRKIVLGVTAGIVLAAMLICTRLQLRHWQNGFALFTHTLGVTENNYVMHNNLGIEFKSQGRFDEAIEQFGKSIKIKSNYAKAHNNLGNVLQAKGRFDEAVSHYRHALGVISNDARIHNNLGFALKLQGKIDEAIEHYHRALQINPNFAQAHNNIGVALGSQGKSGEAISHYYEAIKIEPAYVAAYHNLGIALQSAGKFDEAIICYHKVVEMRPKFAMAYHNIGRALHSQGKFEEAIGYFRQAIKIKPGLAIAHHQLGVSLQFLGKFGESASHFRQALQISPNSAVIHRDLASVLAVSYDNIDEAISHYSKALELMPEWTTAHYDLGITFMIAERIEDSVKHLKEALRQSPDWVQAMNSLAWILATHPLAEDRSEAIGLAERAAELTNYKDASVLDTLAAAYAEAGRFREAVATATKALNLLHSQDPQKDSIVRDLQRRLELYQAGKPYREQP